MSVLKVFVLSHDTARRGVGAFAMTAPEGTVCQFKEPSRSLDQNAAQWPILQAFSDQLEWPVNGKMCKMTPDEWKDVLTAGFKQEQVRLAMGPTGGVVMIGQRTSKMSKAVFSEWLEFLHSVAAERGVNVERK